MNKYVLCMLLAMLLMGCSSTPPEILAINKPMTLGEHGKTSFSNILKETDPVSHTRYGYSEIVFNSEIFLNDTGAESGTFAIFSLPADEYCSTYFSLRTEFDTGDSTSFPYYGVSSFDTTRKFDIVLDDKPCSLSYLLEVNSNNQSNTIAIKGSFEPYIQHNVVIRGLNDVAQKDTTYRYDSPELKRLTQFNSAYLIAYPWRTISVKIEGDSIYRLEAIYLKYYVEKTFKQAICSVAIVNTGYDFKLIIDTSISTVKIMDKFHKEFVPFDSHMPKYAIVGRKPTANSSLYRNVAYAIAYLSGVSYDNDGEKNLLNITGDINANNLSFRQWNQLHAHDLIKSKLKEDVNNVQ